jgi:hypothetical protein
MCIPENGKEISKRSSNSLKTESGIKQSKQAGNGVKSVVSCNPFG